MSVVFSGTNQGVFTSTGKAQNISIRSDVDYMWVFNKTKTAAGAVSTGLQFYWQRGFGQGEGLETQSNGAGTATNLIYITSGGFTLFNNTVNTPGALTAITSISGAQPPVVLVTPALLAGQLNNGDVVRLFNVTGGKEVSGLDFTIGAVTPGGAGTGTFTLAFAKAIAAATTGSFRRIPYDPYFYPPTRVIAKILASTFNGAPSAIVTLTVTHNFTVGQRINFVIPTVTSVAYGMTELNNVNATIIAIGEADADGVTNTITCDVDVSSFTAFAWPLTADPVHTPAQVVPVGENTAVAIAAGTDLLGDSEKNIGFIGMTLAAGTDSPAGVIGDVIYWVAGKSFNA